VRSLTDHSDLAGIAGAYAAATLPELRERYSWITQLDEQRLRAWRGEPVAVDRHDGAYALFSIAAAGAVARVDPDVFRVFNRRIGLLDRIGVLDDDIALRQHIERRFAELRTAQAAPMGPPQAEMVAVVAAAVQ